ncbi:GTP-binding protein [Streptomyces seoulensis]
MTSVNIGILAHVDAGKTSLTERLLHTAGVIDRVGSVDRGDTQTDSHELERRRGITIRSAVVSFTVGGAKVNLIDTPGHPDFISEVERALGVLDGVVLVVSAVEGVQAQTRLLARTLTKLRMPVIVFVNKIDRAGARHRDLLDEIRSELSPDVVALTQVEEIGTARARATARGVGPGDPGFAAELADVLAEHDDGFLARYLDDETSLGAHDYAEALARQARRARLHPVLFGSARTGAGIDALMDAIARFLPAAPGDADGPLDGTVFKIERGGTGEKTAFVRLRGGSLGPRTKVPVFRRDRHGVLAELTGRTTAVEVFDRGSAVVAARARAGDIAKVRGLGDVRIGDRLGRAGELGGGHLFAPPGLESVVRPSRPDALPRLHAALARLADEDPFIDVREDARERTITVSLYGEVHKEVVATTLAEDFGLDVVFEDTRIVCVERPVGVGASVEQIDQRGRTVFWATVGLRVEPGEPGSGVVFRRSVELGSLPRAFHKAIEETVHATLGQGLHGWEVRDVLVTLTHSGYASPVSAAGDFRGLTPLVLMNALKQAGTRVYEPVARFELEVPAVGAGAVLLNLAECGATPEAARERGGSCLVEGTVPVRGVREFEQRLPGLSQGEGVLVTRFHGYRPVAGPAPSRGRTDLNPLDRAAYLLRVFGRYS